MPAVLRMLVALVAAICFSLAAPSLAAKTLTQDELLASSRYRQALLRQPEETRPLPPLKLWGAHHPSTRTKWPIYYRYVAPGDAGLKQKYGVDPDWSASHGLGTSTVSLTNGDLSDSPEYAVFRCQFSCDTRQACLSFFVRFVEGSVNECECSLYDAKLEPTSYVGDNSIFAVGGYNK